MSLRKLRGVAYCTDTDCHELYDADNELFQLAMRDEPLPCGHKLSAIILHARHIKGGDEACEMLDWLLARNYIDKAAFDELEALGGMLDDGLNCRVPKE